MAYAIKGLFNDLLLNTLAGRQLEEDINYL